MLGNRRNYAFSLFFFRKISPRFINELSKSKCRGFSRKSVKFFIFDALRFAFYVQLQPLRRTGVGFGLNREKCFDLASLQMRRIFGTNHWSFFSFSLFLYPLDSFFSQKFHENFKNFASSLDFVCLCFYYFGDVIYCVIILGSLIASCRAMEPLWRNTHLAWTLSEDLLHTLVRGNPLCYRVIWPD